MKITVFTSNQPRHIALIEKLIIQGFSVNVVSEAATICPGSPGSIPEIKTSRQYFERVIESENYIFEISDLSKIIIS